MGRAEEAMARSDVRWLEEDQQAAWRALAALVLKLPGELEAQLQRDSGMTHFEYWVMALLSEAPQRQLPLSRLAGQANASLSRLSHVVTRLERRGWVCRGASSTDARVTLAELTESGWDRVQEAAPGHVAMVRQLVFDGLDTEGTTALRDICQAIVARIDRQA